jgi:hypothetical protein
MPISGGFFGTKGERREILHIFAPSMKIFKQISSLLLTLTAGLALTACEIFPHHHHSENLPCFATENTHCSCPDNCDDSHDPVPESGSCTLDRLLIAAPGNIQDNATSLIRADIPTDTLPAIFLAVRLDLSAPEKTVPARESRYLITLHSIEATRAPGLRAPPRV